MACPECATPSLVVIISSMLGLSLLVVARQRSKNAWTEAEMSSSWNGNDLPETPTQSEHVADNDDL